MNPFDALLADDDPTPGARERAQRLSAALRRDNDFGVLMQMMGTKPLANAGETLTRGSQHGLTMAVEKQQEASRERQRAMERQQAQQNWQASFDQQAANQREQIRQFGITEQRQREAAERENWGAIANPITGEIEYYDKRHGPGPGSGIPGGPRAAPDGGLPQFNPGLGMKPTEKMKNDLVAIQQQRNAVSGALMAAQASPQAFGVSATNLAEQFGGGIGAAMASWVRNPNDTASRAFVLNNVSAIINERAGAAQSVQELARLRGFLPNETDDVPRVTAKFNAFLDYLDEREAATRGYTHEQLGFTRRVGGAGPRTPEAQTPGAAPAQTQAPAGPRPGDKYLTGGG